MSVYATSPEQLVELAYAVTVNVRLLVPVGVDVLVPIEAVRFPSPEPPIARQLDEAERPAAPMTPVTANACPSVLVLCTDTV